MYGQAQTEKNEAFQLRSLCRGENGQRLPMH